MSAEGVELMRNLYMVLCILCASGVASATTITTYSSYPAFSSALTSLGLTASIIDFEHRGDGSAVPAGASSPSNPPLSYSLFNGMNTATFSTTSQFVYESFAWHSAAHSLRETNSGPTSLN